MPVIKTIHLLAAILCVGAALFTACGRANKSPSQIVRDLYDAANAGRYVAAEKYFCADARKYIKGAYPRGLKALCDQQTRYGTLVKVEILKEEIKGDEATVMAKLWFKDKTAIAEKTKLIKERGEWKIAFGR